MFKNRQLIFTVVLLAFLCSCYGILDTVHTAIEPDISSTFENGYRALMLGEHFDLNITITYISNRSSDCLILVETDDHFVFLHGNSDRNVTITHSDGASFDEQTIHVNSSYLAIYLEDVVTNSSGDINTFVRVPISLSQPGSFGDLLNISTSVSSQTGVYEKLTSEETVYYLGPEVNTETGWVDENIVINSYTEITLLLQIPANSNLEDVQVNQEFFSYDLSSLPVTYIKCLALPSSGNITFSNTSKTNISQFDSTLVTTSYYEVRPRRAASTSPLSYNILSWDIGDITNNDAFVAELELQMEFSFSDIPDVISTDVIRHSVSMNLNRGLAQITSSYLGVAIPKLIISKSVQSVGYEDVDSDKIEVLRFTTSISHDMSSSNSAGYEVYVTDHIDGLVVEYFDEFQPPFGTPGLSTTKSRLSYKTSSLAVGDSLTISYKAYFNADTLANGEQDIYFPTTLEWQTLPNVLSTPSFPGTNYGPVEDEVCLKMDVSYDSSGVATRHGFAALAFFVSVLVAMIIVVIVAVVCIQCFHKGPYSLVQPIGVKQTRGLLIGGSNTGANTATSSYEKSSLVQTNDSIVLILMLDQSSQKYTEFDNLDILTTITLDIELEERRIEAMGMSVELLIQQWTEKKLISKDVNNKVTKKFQRSLKDLVKKINDEFRRDSQNLRKQLIAMNSIKLTQLQKKHKKEYENALEDTKSMSDKEAQTEILNLLQCQQDAETANLSSILKLQQDEQQEILRKEYAIRKRIGIKSIQQEYLDQVILQGKLDEEQARQLISDHWQNMAILEKRMDEDISKQRMLLEEKLEQHRAIAARNVSQEEHQKEVLNTMAKQTIGALQQLQEDDQLTEEQVNQYVTKLQKEIVASKEKYENDKKKQEENLHKRMSALKKQKLADKMKEHKAQIDRFEDEHKEKQTEFEPSEYLDSRLQLLSKQKLELNDIENEMDEEAAKELEELREKLTGNIEASIQKTKNNLYSDLKSKGLTNEMKEEILEEHQRNIERLKEEKEEERLTQEENLKKRLAEKRKDWAKRKEDEKAEQMQIREHESKMVGRLLATQLVMSEVDRDKIMQEHEKQMVTLENNLTLNKLHQRRKLEEKIAVRRARQMEKLEKQQQQEERRQLRSKQLDSDDEGDSDEIEKMKKKHAEQRLKLLSSEKCQVDEDLDTIRVEMLHERANALKKQEEELGSMIAQLQMEKAREMATIEEQQKVLTQLKMNMLDDMTERGVIQNSQSKKVIENHRKEVETLETKLNDAREKQEKEFKKRLKEKQKEREKIYLREQELEMARLLDSETNSTRARLKRVALKHKQTIELEDFRQNLEMEKRQSLEDLRRNFQMKKLKAIQDQELRLIGSLIRHGKYGNMELINILKLLFPMKMEKELKQLVLEMNNYNDNEEIEPDSDSDEPKQRENKKKSKKQKGMNQKLTLEKRVRSTILMKPLDSESDSPEPIRKKASKKLAPIKNKKYMEGSLHKSPLPEIHGVRPDPIGRADSIGYATDQSPEDSEEEEVIKKKPLKKGKLKGRKK